MRKLAVGLSLLSIVSMLSGCMGSGGALNVASPIWEAGYSFSYRQQGSYSFAVTADGHSQTEQDEYGPYITVFEVLNTTLEAGEDPVYLTAYTFEEEKTKDAEADEEPSADDSTPSGSMSVAVPNVMFMGFRQRDLAEINAWLELDSDCTAQGCTQNVGGLKFEEAPEWSYIDFPLEKGKTWSAEIALDDGGDELFGEIPVKFQARVVGWKNVDMPLGSVKAVQIDWTTKPVDLEKYKRDVREEADDDDVELDKFNIELERSGSAFYSPEYQALVKSTYRGEYFVEVKGEDDGEKFEFSTRGRDTGEQVLEGVQLVARAERGLDYIARLAMGKAKLNDPTGLAPDQVSYAIKVVADKPVVNAAESEAISFKAQLEGVDALPSGHQINWRMTDILGAQVAKGTGLTFQHEFGQPGEYAVIADAVDEKGTLMATSGTTVFANYLKTIPVECPTIAVSGAGQLTGMCPGALVPVRPGIQYLHVSADVSGPLGAVPLVNQATLVLRDPDGATETDATREQGQYSVEMMMFFEHVVDDREWSLQLVQGRGVMEQASYTIDLRYDAMPAMAMPMGQGLAESLDAWIRER